jgi:vacuolar-type H+-ATPase subunit I/STV1
MPIEKELEKLHEHLKALGSAREKLNGATDHIANVSDAIVNAGESMRRLAEMPELTERIRSSVERLLNESKGGEILEAVKDARKESIQKFESLRTEQKQFSDRLEAKVNEAIVQVRNETAILKRMVWVVIGLVIVVLLGFSPLIYKIWCATLK